ncbi:serine--tRNA ligase [Flavobacteriaceae bacterium]|jgi:seryl-tRNA synthetase|nr:serine--tRNA ligase [Flavobacteriaceae bacterium]|tara:strand:+ start:6859 stop:8130 length:1272 start_codon:yes stop_codon:yes gene_type:complete
MLELQFIRENKEVILKGLEKRNFKQPELINEIIDLDKERRNQQATLDQQLAKANQLANKIGELFKSGKIEKATSLKEETSRIKKQTKTLQEKLQEISDILFELRTQIPNLPHESVPRGISEEDNEEIFKSGTIPQLNDKALPHWELASKYDLIDFELGSKITGAGFPVYKGKGARLQRGLINYFLDKNTAAGYKEMQVPHLVNEASGFGTGQLPDKEGQMYHVKNDDLYLIPTAEIPLTNLYRNTILEANKLPICLTGYTPCFRREAGSYGAHVRGLNRLHQFDKVEIIRIEEPKNAMRALDKMVEHVKSILNDLELPYRILRLCGGDLGFTSALTYDFEIYSAAQERWLEISSISTFNSFQAERLKLRYKDKAGNKQNLHTLNGSSLALPRVVAGLLENCQTPDGIIIPKILIPYTGFDKIV